ncbi:MAG: hypothetical protein WCY67_10185 [Acidithiobacillus sp.]
MQQTHLSPQMLTSVEAAAPPNLAWPALLFAPNGAGNLSAARKP